jgi:hypothetical protein
VARPGGNVTGFILIQLLAARGWLRSQCWPLRVNFCRRVASASFSRRTEGAIDDAIIAGWTGRDPAAVEKHIRELEALGVKRPASTPIFYRFAAARLTTGAAACRWPWRDWSATPAKRSRPWARAKSTGRPRL